MNVNKLVEKNVVTLVKEEDGKFIFSISKFGREFQFPVYKKEFELAKLEGINDAEKFRKFIQRQLDYLY